MRIAVDIDSTLHHYWDVLSDAAKRRFGVDLPYDQQFTWGVTRLRDEQLRVVIEDTHSDDAIAAGRPYPHAVETINGWHDAGHFIHVTSHRAERCRGATEAWLNAIGLRFDELYCSFDKLERCRDIGIDILIDDSPATLVGAIEHGIRVATIAHPWNRDVRDEEDIIAAENWRELGEKLEPLLDDRRTR